MVIVEEELELADCILDLFMQPCINDNEIIMLENLCSSIYDNLTTKECKATYLVAYTLRLRKSSCLDSLTQYLQDYSNCNSCNLDINNIIVGTTNGKLYALGGSTESGSCC